MTELQRHSHPLRVFEDLDGQSREVDLSTTPLTSFFSNDHIRMRFTGSLPPVPDLRLSNFIECTLHDFLAEDVDFTLCDFKDCVIRASTFRRCKFNDNSFLMNTVFDTEFSECTFYNCSTQGAEFRSARFISCDLTNILVKSSKFINCEFVDCHTSNKIMEMSLVLGTRFVRTDIQLDTITSNFGITAGDLNGSVVRSGRYRDVHQRLTPTGVHEVDRASMTPLERLRLEYFDAPDLTDGSDALDESLKIMEWPRIYQSPGSFGDVLQLFAEFLVQSYENNRTTLQPLLHLHQVTAILAEAASEKTEFKRVAISVDGVHMMLARIVERFLTVLDSASAIYGQKLVMLVEGPLKKEYYEELLRPWMRRGRVTVASLVPRNSPAIITFAAENASTLVPLLAIFLATRTSLQIFRVEDDLAQTQQALLTGSSKGTSEAVSRSRGRRKELLNISTGPAGKSRDFRIRVRAVLSSTLLVDLKLAVGTRLAGRLRHVLLALISDKKSGES